jgi:hypothetical protein
MSPLKKTVLLPVCSQIVFGDVINFGFSNIVSMNVLSCLCRSEWFLPCVFGMCNALNSM